MVFPQEFLQCLWNRVEPGSSGIRPELSGDSSPLSLRLKAARERRHRAKTAGKAGRPKPQGYGSIWTAEGNTALCSRIMPFP